MAASTKKILLVEDDRFLRRACEASLRQRGFTVVPAMDGEEGLRLARGETPDLILLVLLNSSREQDVAEVMELGAVDYWVKANLSLKELSERVVRLLGA